MSFTLCTLTLKLYTGSLTVNHTKPRRAQTELQLVIYFLYQSHPSPAEQGNHHHSTVPRTIENCGDQYRDLKQHLRTP